MKDLRAVLMSATVILFLQGCLAGNKPEPFSINKNSNVDIDKVLTDISNEVKEFDPKSKCLTTSYTNTSPTSGISLSYLYNMCLETDGDKINSITSCVTTQTNPDKITTIFNPVTKEHSIQFRRYDNTIEKITLKELAVIGTRAYKKGDVYFWDCDYSEGIMGIGKLDGSKDFKEKATQVKSILQKKLQ